MDEGAAPLIDERDLEISREAINVSGGTCDLFVGEHVKLGKVALKRLRCDESQREDAMLRFNREGCTWSQLKHEHVLPFYGVCQTDLHVYLVSPLAENGSLSSYTKSHPEADKIRLLYETALAIEYLHQQGVIHGDIKGSNVLVSCRISALLCDFGLSRLHDVSTSIGQKGWGSMRWQSAEIINDGSKTFKSDVYAFGMTIYERRETIQPFKQPIGPLHRYSNTPRTSASATKSFTSRNPLRTPVEHCPTGMG